MTLIILSHRKVLEKGPQAIVTLQEVLRDDAHLADDRHEVCVPFPARDDMPMEVTLHSGAGTAAQVHPEIDAFGLERRRDSVHRLLQGHGEISILFPLKRSELIGMSARGEKEMTIAIGVLVQQHNGVSSLGQNQIRTGILFSEFIAEDAPGLSGAADVGHSPGGPDLLHEETLAAAP